jgi:hypothetical protein
MAVTTPEKTDVTAGNSCAVGDNCLGLCNAAHLFADISVSMAVTCAGCDVPGHA